MLVSFPCPHCARLVSVSHEYAGQRGPCPFCRQTFAVPPAVFQAAGVTPPAGVSAPGNRYGYGPPGHYPGSTAAVFFLLFCILLFALANLLLMPLSSWCRSDAEATPIFICMGAIGAQAGLHAIWCILAPVGWVKRLAGGVVAGLVLFGAWALGYALYPASFYWEEVSTGLLCLPLLAVAIQAPLWGVRNWCGWRLVHLADASASSGGQTFGIREMLVATAVLAVALSAARLAKPEDIASDADFLFPLGIGALAAGGISLLTTLPTLPATLRGRRWWIALPVVLPVYPIIVIAFIEIVSAMEGSRPPPEAYTLSAWIVGAYCVCLSGVLLGVRRLGYRLVWGRRQQGHDSETPPAGGAPADEAGPVGSLPALAPPQSGY